MGELNVIKLNKTELPAGLFFRTPNNLCPACRNKRLHEQSERTKYHPLAGEGFTKEQGWTNKLKDGETI